MPSSAPSKNSSVTVDPILYGQLHDDEDEKLKPYYDTKGKLTIGIGRNLTDKGITPDESRFLFSNDIEEVERQLDRYLPWWRSMNPPRQRALINLCFNMGIGDANHGLRSFYNTLNAMRDGRWQDVYHGLIHSKWARDVGYGRSHRRALQFLTGEDQ